MISSLSGGFNMDINSYPDTQTNVEENKQKNFDSDIIDIQIEYNFFKLFIKRFILGRNQKFFLNNS